MTEIVIYILSILLCLSVFLMFYWENKVGKLWLRLPIINLFLLVILLVLMIMEEIYLTCHPHERTKYIRTSIKQRFFDP
jgi:NADH:ubiquinone oxidoreductase subunit 6 (subunit J)